MKKSLSSIKYYFAVDQTYVVKKLCLLLFPFRPRVSRHDVTRESLRLPSFRTGHSVTVQMNRFLLASIPTLQTTTYHVRATQDSSTKDRCCFSSSDERHDLRSRRRTSSRHTEQVRRRHNMRVLTLCLPQGLHPNSWACTRHRCSFGTSSKSVSSASFSTSLPFNQNCARSISSPTAVTNTSA